MWYDGLKELKMCKISSLTQIGHQAFMTFVFRKHGAESMQTFESRHHNKIGGDKNKTMKKKTFLCLVESSFSFLVNRCFAEKHCLEYRKV